MNLKCDLAGKQEKLQRLEFFLSSLETTLREFTNDVGWSYDALVEGKHQELVTCSINERHRIPKPSVKVHEEKCKWRDKGYNDGDLPFSYHPGQGSFVVLDSYQVYNITKSLPSPYQGDKSGRELPQTSAKLDQEFSREEKLAIYDHVIANTNKQKGFPELYTELLSEKKVETKKELSAWEIAAAERDAKRRRASYRNKVHTNRKTYTEIMKEVIDVQMESLKGETLVAESSKSDKLREEGRRSEHKKNHRKWNENSRWVSTRECTSSHRPNDRRRYREDSVDFSHHKRRHSPHGVNRRHVSKSWSKEEHGRRKDRCQ